MSKLMIFYIDRGKDIPEYLLSNFKSLFNEYEVNIQNQENIIITNIENAINSNYIIPLIFITDKFIYKFGNSLLYEIKEILKQTNLIFISSENSLNNISKNIKNIGFYNYLTKYNLINNFYTTINEALNNYKMNIQLENSYKKDSLTGLLNRHALLKDIKASKNPLVLLINVDNFRNINSTYGYKFGDIVLKKLSQEMTKLSSHDLYRLISDEFVLLCQRVTKEEAYDIASRFKETIQNKNFLIENEIVNITISIAISNNETNIIEDAQDAIIESMKNHKNNIVYTKCINEQRKDKFNINSLRLAFAKDKIIPFYQGIRNNKNGLIEKYECLVRIKDENNKVISPFLFLDLAQSYGLITRITRIIIEKSFKYFTQNDFDFSINLTEDDLKEQYIIDYLIKMSNKYKINLNRVTFEILENINLENSSLIFSQIVELKKIGCKIAFDDFGCEKSNFSRLLDLNIDFVKIDSIFIKNINTDIKSYKLTKAITNLAKDFDCKIIAEGVENEEIQKIIEELEIDYTQGYYFSIPKEKI